MSTTTNTTDTATTATLKVVTKELPPRDGSNLKPREKSELRLLIEGLEIGQCLEYRGSKPQSHLAHLTHAVKKESGKVYAVRKAVGGCDIYRIAAE